MGRVRLDQLLTDRGLAHSRAQAQALIHAGDVLLDGAATRRLKPGQLVDADAAVSLVERPRWASRAGAKLEHALAQFGVNPSGLACLDAGASTGGFTDVLLQRGAARVVALDVGYGQLHPRLRADPRVTVLERVNARGLEHLPFAPELLTCDVSFISARLVLPPALALAAPGWEAVVLVKPQFEAGRDEVGRGGVVRDPVVHRRVVSELAEAALAWGAETAGAVDSGLPGPKGNREFFLHIVQRERPQLRHELAAWIDAAVA